MAAVSLASVTSTFMDLGSRQGVVAVFVLMAVDALLPAGGELIMLLAGALAAGVVSHGTAGVGTGVAAYAALATAGTLGYLGGALGGWLIGRRGGRRLAAHHGRWLHFGPQRLRRAERWFDRHGRAAILLGRMTPVVRSYISVPAGMLGAPLGRYVALTLLGSAIWCFGFAAAGWALGAQWESLHASLRYIDAAAVAGVVIVAAGFALRARSRTA